MSYSEMADMHQAPHFKAQNAASWLRCGFFCSEDQKYKFCNVIVREMMEARDRDRWLEEERDDQSCCGGLALPKLELAAAAAASETGTNLPAPLMDIIFPAVAPFVFVVVVGLVAL